MTDWHEAIGRRGDDVAAVWVGRVLCCYPKNNVELGRALILGAAGDVRDV